jgi:NAD(P)H-hydrate repair Nnr-like enzyme with NAD(P)H-hydrate dehydratase domain
VAAGAYINGYAGDIAKGEVGEIPLLASDTASAVGKAIKEITE